MNTLLLFFALPVATILLAIVLQKILKCPILVAITFFAIYLIVAFSAFDATFLVFAIVYAILAYITAVLVKFICRILRRFGKDCSCICDNERDKCCNNDTDEATCRITEEDVNEIARQAARQTTRDLLACINNNSNHNNCCCNRR